MFSPRAALAARALPDVAQTPVMSGLNPRQRDAALTTLAERLADSQWSGTLERRGALPVAATLTCTGGTLTLTTRGKLCSPTLSWVGDQLVLTAIDAEGATHVVAYDADHAVLKGTFEAHTPPSRIGHALMTVAHEAANVWRSGAGMPGRHARGAQEQRGVPEGHGEWCVAFKARVLGTPQPRDHIRIVWAHPETCFVCHFPFDRTQMVARPHPDRPPEQAPDWLCLECSRTAQRQVASGVVTQLVRGPTPDSLQWLPRTLRVVGGSHLSVHAGTEPDAAALVSVALDAVGAVRSSPERPDCFFVETATAQLVFAAPTAEAARDWVTALQKLLNAGPFNVLSPRTQPPRRASSSSEVGSSSAASPKPLLVAARRPPLTVPKDKGELDESDEEEEA